MPFGWARALVHPKFCVEQCVMGPLQKFNMAARALPVISLFLVPGNTGPFRMWTVDSASQHVHCLESETYSFGFSNNVSLP